jgi:bifunctional DNA-binding transcriptional regulator/antitoxin component of YhaV-PrlF toxin-antitoxin module
MQVVKVSKNGQMTLPKSIRDQSDIVYYAVEQEGRIIRLIPLKKDEDDLKDFNYLALSGFAEIWDNEEDDIYQKFYEKNRYLKDNESYKKSA